MKRLSRVLLAVGLSLLFVNVMWGQFTIQVIATDGVNSDTLVLGTAVGATSGIDAGQGEVELPPVPPAGIFDARFAAFTGVTLGQGTAKDVRGYTSTKQNGSYRVKWQSSTEGTHSDSIVFSWPAGLGSVAGGYWHMTSVPGSGGTLDIDMASATSGAVSNDDGTVVITTGDKSAFTTFTYQRFFQDLDVKGKAKSTKSTKKGFFWPNVHNAGEEMSKNAANVPMATIGSSATQSILIKKYGDWLKSASVKGVSHSADSIFCLAYLPHTAKGKSYAGFLAPDSKNNGKLTKQSKPLDPTPGKAMQSYLYAQLATLEFNLKVSGQYTPAGLGALVLNDGSQFAGLTVNQLRDKADSAFSCVTMTATLKEVTDELEAVNKAFNKSTSLGYAKDTAHVDTLAGTAWTDRPKGTALALAGWLPLAKVTWLSGGASSAPVNEHNAVVENVQPSQYSLEQNYPNPFNPSTKIQFNLVNDGMVSVKIFNMLGQEVATLANQEMSAGTNNVTFDASAMASGVYFYRVSVNDLATGKLMFSDMKKMMLVK